MKDGKEGSEFKDKFGKSGGADFGKGKKADGKMGKSKHHKKDGKRHK